jgi:hypothetical protein
MSCPSHKGVSAGESAKKRHFLPFINLLPVVSFWKVFDSTSQSHLAWELRITQQTPRVFALIQNQL